MSGQASKENGKKGGRPIGRKNDATLEKERELSAVKQRIMKNAQKIIDSQLSLSRGLQFLYRIDTEIVKGKRIRSKPILVVDSEEIANYLDGEFGDGESLNDETAYYYITASVPNNMASDSMLNRAFGKPTENMELKGTISVEQITGMNIVDDGNKLQDKN